MCEILVLRKIIKRRRKKNFSNPWIDCAMIQKAEEAETFIKIASENQ